MTDWCPNEFGRDAPDADAHGAGGSGDRSFELRGPTRAIVARTVSSPYGAESSRVADDHSLHIATAGGHFPASSRDTAETDAAQYLGRKCAARGCYEYRMGGRF